MLNNKPMLYAPPSSSLLTRPSSGPCLFLWIRVAPRKLFFFLYLIGYNRSYRRSGQRHLNADAIGWVKKNESYLTLQYDTTIRNA